MLVAGPDGGVPGVWEDVGVCGIEEVIGVVEIDKGDVG